MNSTGITIQPLLGKDLTLQTGDAILFAPNTLPNCIFSGAVHSTITKLKGK